MSEPLEHLVRESLRTVDRSRRIAAATISLLFAVVLLTLAFLFARVRADGQVTGKMLWVAVAGQMSFVGICVALLASHMTRMTKAVLRSIELTRK
jgi:hypothetical protein